MSKDSESKEIESENHAFWQTEELADLLELFEDQSRLDEYLEKDQ